MKNTPGHYDDSISEDETMEEWRKMTEQGEAAAPTGGITILRSDWVLPIASEPVQDGAVAVEGELIKAVGPAAEVMGAFAGAKVLDFHDSILLPGFINCHSHVEYSVFRGLIDDKNFGAWILDFIDYRSLLGEADHVASARLGASECVASGITTLADGMYFGASIDAIRDAGLRARIYQEAFGLDDHRLEEDMAALAARLDELEGMAGGLIEIGVFPHAPYTVSANHYRAIAELARERGLKIATHLAESRAESTYIKSGTGVLAHDLREKVGWDYISREPFGVSPVKYLQQWSVYGPDVLAVHCVNAGPRDIDILAKSDVAIAHCPKSNAKLGCGVAPLPAFLEAGIRVGFGTDSPASSNIMDIFGEMRTAIFLHRAMRQDATVLGAAECVQMATLGGARALGMEDAVGTLEPGKQADIIVVDMEFSHFTPIYDPYSSLVYGASQEDVFFKMVAGRTIYDKKVILTIDEEETRARAREVKDRLRA
ncbi:MAG: amidohydrolase [Gaiellales bacterium]|nr:MAG: amidohydrolase [Gaiellales bacterium]